MDTRVRGVLIFECNYCKTFFSMVMVQGQKNVYCPGCSQIVKNSIGDGVTTYNIQKTPEPIVISNQDKLYLNATDIHKLLGISKSTAYELLRQKDCPTLNVGGEKGGRKLVKKDEFLIWLETKKHG
ncbi:helix-turn-helix domain-containing protein [Metabacillus sp. FJAT-52054]|uniref:Helix-turn-helix domain-containing protein n=1 Tax=Metabacillus sediminis TaxID=3117746 RepID=A0ABZ2NNA5_9BACI